MYLTFQEHPYLACSWTSGWQHRWRTTQHVMSWQSARSAAAAFARICAEEGITVLAVSYTRTSMYGQTILTAEVLPTAGQR